VESIPGQLTLCGNRCKHAAVINGRLQAPSSHLYIWQTLPPVHSTSLGLRKNQFEQYCQVKPGRQIAIASEQHQLTDLLQSSNKPSATTSPAPDCDIHPISNNRRQHASPFSVIKNILTTTSSWPDSDLLLLESVLDISRFH